MSHDDSSFHLVWTPFLRKHHGRMLQAIGLVCRIAPAAGDRFTMRLAGRTYAALGSDLLRLPGEVAAYDAKATYLWLVPRPAKPTACQITWKPIQGNNRKARLLIQPARPMNIHLVLEPDVGQCIIPKAMPSEMLGIEELCRMLYGARQWTGHRGRKDKETSTAVSLAGPPAHSASLAMAMVAAGGRFLHVRAGQDAKPQDIPPLFLWSLPDKRTVLCHHDSGTRASLIPPADYKYRHWLCVEVGSAALQLSKQALWVAERFDQPTYCVGRLNDFAEAVAQDHGSRLPVIKGELVDGSVADIARRPCIAAHRRATERLTSAEILRTMIGQMTGRRPSAAERDSYRRGYAELSQCADGNQTNGISASRPVLGPGVQRLESAAVNMGAKLASGRGQAGILLFNVTGWPRGGLVQMSAAALPTGEFEMIDPTTGGIVVYHRQNDRIEFIAPTVPACGYLRLEIRPTRHRQIPGPQADWDQRQLTLHFDQYVLQFHAAGGMCRWHDRDRSMQWCSNKVEFPMGTYLTQLAGGSLVGGGKATITPHIGPLRTQIVVEADCATAGALRKRTAGQRRYRTTFTLYRGQGELRTRIELIGKQPTPESEVGYGFFPLYGDNPFMLIDRGAQLIEPRQDLFGKVKPTSMAVHRGVRVECDHAGVNFYPLDTPIINFDKPTGQQIDAKQEYKDGVLYAPISKTPSSSFDFVLKPTGNDIWDGGLARGGAEVFRPIIGTVIRGLCDKPARSLVRVEPDLVHLLALKPADDGNGVILRLWSADPDPLIAKLTLPEAKRGSSLTVCDLLERMPGRVRLAGPYLRPGNRIPIDRNGRTQVPMRPHQIVTLLLTAES